MLAALDILPFDEPTDRRYGEIRQALEPMGTPIGANDLLIAAHTLAHGLILVTANEVRVGLLERGLSNWIQCAGVNR